MNSEQKTTKQEELARDLLIEITKATYSHPGAYAAMSELAKAESRTFSQELVHQSRMLAGTFYNQHE